MKTERFKFKHVLSLLLSCTILASVLPLEALAVEKITPPDDKVLISQTNYTLTSGVTETDVFLNASSGNAQIAGYMLTVEPTAQATFKASYKGYYAAGSTLDSRKNSASNLTWALESTSNQAAAYEKATGGNVIAATNGDYYNMQTGQPLGYLIMEGNLIQKNNGSSNEPYFAVLKDGSYAIRDAGTDCSDVQEAISGPFYLVHDGKIVADAANTDLMPRNSIGMKPDGTVVTFVADGRQYPYSVGMTLYELASYYCKQGVTEAIYLDGGGSATFASKREGTNTLEIRNSPSDGVERTVSSALLLVSTAAQDGTFDHAAVQPNNQLYTPGSTVQFTASGVDASGGPAELPSDTTWQLADSSCGTIDQNGTFTPAENYRGDVTAQLLCGDKVVGSTTVSIADITALSFSGESISLDFNVDSNLGLTVKSNGRDIHYKDGDFDWTVSDGIGTVKNNTFTAVGGTSTLTGSVTAAYKYNSSLTASITVEIGKMPVVLMDFEPNENGPLTCAHYHWGKNTFVDNGTTKGYESTKNPSLSVVTNGSFTGNETTANVSSPYRFTGNYDTAVPAGDIFRTDGYSFYLWPNNSITTYNVGAVKTTTEADGGYVRFGDYSLELNYDYSSYNGSSNSNFYVRYCGEPIAIDGYPTELGVWVYVPEGSWPYAMYADLAVWDGSNYVNKNIQLKHAKDGNSSNREESNLSATTDWSGWRYCFVNIKDVMATYQNAEHPVSILPGRGLFWISYQPGGDPDFKGRKNGSLFFDNYRAVYGTNLDDLDNPVIDSITVNSKDLEESGRTVIDQNSIELEAKYHDVNGANKSGINANATVVLIDGTEVTADKASDAAICRIELTNGHHVVTVRAYDNFGNATEATRGFTVFNGKDSETSTVSIKGDDFVPLGGNYEMKVVSTENIQSASITLANLNADIGEPTVTPATGWDATTTYQSTGYKKASLTIKLKKSSSLLKSIALCSLDDLLTKELATITFHISKDLDTTVNSFTYTPTNITYTDAQGKQNTAALPASKIELSAYYTLKPGIQIEGQSSSITVLNKDSTPASGVTVYLNGNVIGKTDENGILETDAMKSLSAGTEYTLSADGTAGVAEAVKATVLANSFSEESAFWGIHLNASQNGATTQNISYLGSPTQINANVRYRVANSQSDWTTVSGTSTLTSFSTTKNSARVNTVTITGLTPKTTYEFQVGNGTDWSEIGTFRTSADSGETSFFVMGDTQMSGNEAEDAGALTIMQNLSNILKNKTVDFGLQTGDYVDNGSNLAMWKEMQEAFSSCYPATDIIHTLGNHEYYGDAAGNIANNILQLPGRDYYSVEYGNVYVAVFNNSADLKKACAWLIEDAAKSSCPWKVLAVHQSPYYTNVKGGSERFHEAIPSAAEQAGINVVFSGHDHSYARTPMLKDGQTVEKNGVTYFICGDLGEKSRDVNYAISSDFSYKYKSQDYEGLMLYVTATDSDMNITAYDSANGGSIIDSVSLSSPCKDGHDYNLYENGKLLCSRCGHAESPAAIHHTGWVTVKGTDDQMYFVDGSYKTGWFTIGTTTYHFSDSGIMHHTTTVDTRTCTKSGALVTTCDVCGATQSGQALWPEGHRWDENHVCTKCGMQGKDISKAELTVYRATMDDPRCAVTATYDGTKLALRSSQVNTDGYITYSNNSGVGMGTVTITGVGDFYGVVTAQYQITPGSVKTVSKGAVTNNSIELNWTASKGATQYRVEMRKDSDSAWSVVGHPTENKLTVTGLEPNTKYVFRLYGYTYVNDKPYSAPYYSSELSATTRSTGVPATQDYISSITAEVSGMTVPMQIVDETAYLFLPSSADLSNLSLTFALRDHTASEISLTGSAGSTTLNSLSGSVNMTAVTGSNGGSVRVGLDNMEEMPLYVMKSDNVSSLFITSDDPSNQGRDFVDDSKSNKTTAKMKLVSENGSVVYDGALTQVKARGNTTFANAPKKSYQIKLKNETDLINCGEKNKTWVLLAGYFDATQLHDKTYKDLAAAISMPYVPNSDWVDLYYDGEYRGTYLLGEKNSVGNSGIDITDMEDVYSQSNKNYGANETTATAENRFGATYQYTENLTEPDNITGGYLLELNLSGYDEASGFNTTHGASVNVKSPEWCGKDAMKYISEYYQEFEDAVYATDANGAHTGYNAQTCKYYYDYCDLTSLVQMYLLEELSSNVDGFYSSFYFYKDADGIMYAGPVWDMESTSGTGWSGYVDPQLEFINGRYLAKALVQIPGFMTAAKDYYNSTFKSAAMQLIGSNGTLNSNAQRINASTAMNYTLWPYVRVGNPNSSSHLWSGATYNTVVQDMVSWMGTRISALDKSLSNGSSEPVEPVDPTVPVEPAKPVNPEKRAYIVEANYYTNNQKDNSSPIILTSGSADVDTTVNVSPESAWATYAGNHYTLSTENLILSITSDADRNVLSLRYDRTVSSSGGGSSSGGSGSGGASTAPSYSISTGKSENGSFSISSKSAAKGATVTITVTPDKGYKLDTLRVLDKNGNSVKLTEVNGKYTFTMPDGNVTITSSFVKETSVSAEPFTDVKSNDYFHDAVLWAAQKGITSGTDATHFSPNAACTRAQIVTFLWRAAGSPAPKSTGSFTDVSANSYYAKAVAWAVENGITGGTGSNRFSPDATCTREQAVTFLYRASGSPAVSGGSAFTDVAANAYYANAVVWAEQTNVTGGIGGGLFGSGNDCTRGQIVTFLYRTMQGK